MAEEWTEYDGGVVQEWHRSASHIRVAPAVAVIPEGAFDECEQLVVVDLSSVTTISNFAFHGCNSLEHIVWTAAPAVEIGEAAFSSCHSLREIDLSNATKIGGWAFFRCEALTSVRIPSSVTEIEFEAFCSCCKLIEVELDEGIQRIGNSSFNGCSSLVRINVPASVADIGTSAFYACSRLADVKLNEGLQCVGERAFKNCLSLERITVPSSVTLIDASTFEECTSLVEVTLCEGVQCIAGDAFYGCDALERISIPPVAFAIDIGRSGCQLMRTGKLHSLMRTAMPRSDAGRKLIVSKWMQYRSPSQLAQARGKVNEILGDGGRQQPEFQKIALIREWFAYFDRLDVTTMLELAIWKVNMDGNERDGRARQARRQNCGGDMNVIIPAVLPFLEG